MPTGGLTTAQSLATAMAVNWPVTRAATAYDVDAAGLLNSFAANVPLIGSEAGFYGNRVEAASSNLVQRSQELDNAYWTKTSVTVTANTNTAPDGTTTADTLTDSDNSVSGRITKNIPVTDDSTYWTVSIFVLKTGAPSIYPVLRAVFSGGTPPSAAVVALNTQTGAIVSVNAVNAGVQDCGNYWRLWVATQNNSTGNTTLQYNFYPAGATSLSTTLVPSATGSNVAWGAQQENLPVPTSYIPTAGSAASRDAALTLRDVSVNVQQAFSICARMRLPAAGITGTYTPYLFSLNDNTANNAINCRLQASSGKIRVEAVVGGVMQGNVQLGNVLTFPSEVHVAVRVRAGQIDASLGGGAVTPIWSGQVPNLSKICWGRDITAASANFLNGLTRSMELMPYDLNDNGLMAFGA